MAIPPLPKPITRIEKIDSLTFHFVVVAEGYTEKDKIEIQTITKLHLFLRNDEIEQNVWSDRFSLLGESLYRSWGSVLYNIHAKPPFCIESIDLYRGNSLVFSAKTWKIGYQCALNKIDETLVKYKELVNEREEKIRETFEGWDDQETGGRGPTKRSIIV